MRVLFRQPVQVPGDDLLQSAAVFAQFRKRVARFQSPLLARLIKLLLDQTRKYGGYVVTMRIMNGKLE